MKDEDVDFHDGLHTSDFRVVSVPRRGAGSNSVKDGDCRCGTACSKAPPPMGFRAIRRIASP
jgi:hypothetical protein